MKLMWGKSDSNAHGTERIGDPWNKETVLGPKFKLVRLGYSPTFVGRRLIFYFPDGSWWYLDAYYGKKT